MGKADGGGEETHSLFGDGQGILDALNGRRRCALGEIPQSPLRTPRSKNTINQS